MTSCLIELCSRFDLRWPVVMDRFTASFPEHSFYLEDLKARYYTTQTTVATARHTTSLVPRDFAYDREHARRRRLQLEVFYSRTKCETEAEKELLGQAQSIELLLKKIDQEFERIRPMVETSMATPVFDMILYKDRLSSASLFQDSDLSYLTSKTTQHKHEVFFNYLPEIRAGRPGRSHLRSSLLHNPIQVGTKMGKRVDSAITDLGLDLKPMPTQLCGIAFDALRKDLMLLIDLHALLTKRHAYNQLLRERVRQAQFLSSSSKSHDNLSSK